MYAQALNDQASEREAKAQTSEYSKALQASRLKRGIAQMCEHLHFQVLGIMLVQALSLLVRTQAPEEQASACKAGARASEGCEAAASALIDALTQGIAQMWERLHLHCTSRCWALCECRC